LDNAHNIDLDTVRLLLKEAKAGENEAQSDLAALVQDYLTTMADKNLHQDIRCKVAVSDIVQRTLLQMVQGLEGFRGQSTPEFYGWLNRIVCNETAKARRDLGRKKRNLKRQVSFSTEDSVGNFRSELIDRSSPTPGTQAIANERIELFHQALARLPKEYAEVIRLRNLDQLTFKEVAAKMNRSVDSVSNLWYRAIAKFEKEIGAVNDPGYE